ncbi:sugar MFS transporter [Coprobacter sp.]
MTTQNKIQQPVTNTKNFIVSIAIMGGLFFTFGFVSWVNAILIPYFRISCELTHFQSYLVTFAFYIAYFIMAIPASVLLNKFGFKKGMRYGLWAMALGALLFVPAAYTRTYGVFLTGLFTLGTGLAILQTAANPYVTIIGPIESAARRISIMGLCNKFAGIISPLIFAALVLRATDNELFTQLNQNLIIGPEREAVLNELIRRVMLPYTGLAILLFLFGIGISRSPLPEINTRQANNEEDSTTTEKNNILQYPHLILGAFAIFLHVGTQVIAIDTIIGYAESMGIGLVEAKVFPSYTLTCTLIGYFLGVLFIPQIISQTKALILCTTLGLAFSFGVIFASGNITLFGHQTDLSIWFLVLMGLPNALIYAGIWPLAINGLGRFTNLGSSLLVMGLCGNAFLPMIYGMLADHYDVRTGYWVLIPCFLYLIFFAIWGHKIKDWKTGK